MNKIYFLRDIKSFSIKEIPDNTILIYKEGYNIPVINNVEYIEFEKYKSNYIDKNTDLIIIVGLNRIITPSNRCEMVHEYLTTLTPNISKISIDSDPFIGEPWRLFFHYLYTNNNKFSVPHSYALETEWQKWFYRETNHCRLDSDNIKMFINNTYSDLKPLVTEFEFYEPQDNQMKWYIEAKEHIFSKYQTPKLLINSLLKLTNQYFQIKITMDSFRNNENFMLPNVGIYKFMVEENLRRMHIYNKIIE